MYNVDTTGDVPFDGTYGGMTRPYASATFLSGDTYNVLDAASSPRLTITKIIGSEIHGTFNCTLKTPYNGKTVTITDGSFVLK